MSAFPNTVATYSIIDIRTGKYLRTMIIDSYFGKHGCDDTARIECSEPHEYPVPEKYEVIL